MSPARIAWETAGAVAAIAGVLLGGYLLLSGVCRVLDRVRRGDEFDASVRAADEVRRLTGSGR